jgi:hypothetical protein
MEEQAIISLYLHNNKMQLQMGQTAGGEKDDTKVSRKVKKKKSELITDNEESRNTLRNKQSKRKKQKGH